MKGHPWAVVLVAAAMLAAWPAVSAAPPAKASTPGERRVDMNTFLKWAEGIRGLASLRVENAGSPDRQKYTVYRRDGKPVQYDYKNGKETLHVVGIEYGYDPVRGVAYCQGSVHITSGTAFMDADFVEYEAAKDHLNFHGNVKLGDSSRVISGNAGSYEVVGGTGEITSSSPEGCLVEMKAEDGTTAKLRPQKVQFILNDGELSRIEFLDFTGSARGLNPKGDLLPAHPAGSETTHRPPPKGNVAP